MKYKNISTGMRVKLKHNHTSSGIQYTAAPVGSIGVVYKFVEGRNDAVWVVFNRDNVEYAQLIHVCDITLDKKVNIL